MNNKLTVAKLLAQKESIKKKKSRTQTLLISSLDAEIVVQEPSRTHALEALGLAQDATKSDMADPFIVYHCVTEPNLKDPELQKGFGCVEPTDIVQMLFLPGEIAAISGHAMELAGYGAGVQKVDSELKN